MSGFLNFVKSIFSGVFGFLGGLVNPSKSRYFLELEDAKPAGAGALPAKAIPAESPKPTPVQTQSQPVAAAKPEPVSQPPAPALAAKTEPEAASAPKEETKSSKAKSPKVENFASAEKAPDQAAIANALNLPQPAVATFAPNYLTPTATSSRRRPGANMSSYLDMARQVKTPG